MRDQVGRARARRAERRWFKERRKGLCVGKGLPGEEINDCIVEKATFGWIVGSKFSSLRGRWLMRVKELGEWPRTSKQET